MKNLEPLDTVTHTHTHKTFYKNGKVSNTICSEAVLGDSLKLNNKYKLEIEML